MPHTDQEIPQSGFSASTSVGATISNAYVGRQVKVYAVFETEVETLTSLNAQATVYFSVGSALLSFGVGIWTAALFTEKLSAEAAVATKVGVPILGLLAIASFGLAVSAWYKRKKTIDSIKQQSVAGGPQ
jgi:hypothetical protein